MLKKLMLTQKPGQKMITQAIVFILLCIATLGFLLCCASLIIVRVDTPEYMLVPITTGLLTFAAFLDSFIMAKMLKENGMIIGLIVSGIFVLMLIVASVVLKTFSMTNIFLTKTFAIIIAGALGGILGVNAK